jgi:hypothetical protein
MGMIGNSAIVPVYPQATARTGGGTGVAAPMGEFCAPFLSPLPLVFVFTYPSLPLSLFEADPSFVAVSLLQPPPITPRPEEDEQEGRGGDLRSLAFSLARVLFSFVSLVSTYRSSCTSITI